MIIFLKNTNTLNYINTVVFLDEINSQVTHPKLTNNRQKLPATVIHAAAPWLGGGSSVGAGRVCSEISSSGDGCMLPFSMEDGSVVFFSLVESLLGVSESCSVAIVTMRSQNRGIKVAGDVWSEQEEATWFDCVRLGPEEAILTERNVGK